MSGVRDSSIKPVSECANGFRKAGDLVRCETPELLISKYRQRQLERIDLIRADPERRGARLGFTSRPFVVCGLSMRRPPRGQLLFERRNGKFKLQLLGHPEFGLPFGQDRLIRIFLATLAVRQQSQTLRFRFGAEMLEMFGMQKGGKEYRRLVGGIERIFGSTIFFGSERTAEGTKLFSRARFHFVCETHIWFDRDPSRAHPAGNRENVIVLSDEFFRELIEHPILSDLEVVRLLAASPGVLDLYLWINYRTFNVKSRQSIPIFGPQGLQAQLGCTEYFETTTISGDADAVVDGSHAGMSEGPSDGAGVPRVLGTARRGASVVFPQRLLAPGCRNPSNRKHGFAVGIDCGASVEARAFQSIRFASPCKKSFPLAYGILPTDTPHRVRLFHL